MLITISSISSIPWADIPWNHMLWPDLTWIEKVVRPFLVYLILLVIFRIANKRDMAQATLFDFLIILLISNVVQNAMIGDDDSILGATAGAVTLIFLSGIFNFVTARSRKARNILEGQPVLLVRQGKINDEMMKRQKITRNDLLSAIRKQGIGRMSDVAFAILEIDGSISVIKTDGGKHPPDCLPFEIAGHESADDEDLPLQPE
jgi:uncharacterized membrane protein YcaP (DUF421 family)